MRLIDADVLRKNSKMLYSIHAFEPIEGYTQDQLDAAPTIDAVPVVHGRWERIPLNAPDDRYGKKYHFELIPIFGGDCTMTTTEFAALLDGREYGSKLTREEAEQAKALGFVVVYGASDDLMEFEGAITDELNAYDGGIAYLDGDEIFHPMEDSCERCKLYQQALSRCKTIEAVWSDAGIPWTYKTDIPHERFDILEDGTIYCRGIVFALADVEGTGHGA